MVFNWNDEKNESLLRERSVSFEQIVIAIEENHLLDILKHPNKEKYAHQYLLLVEIDGYVYVVPCIENDQEIFLKTIFPSRKYTKEYLAEKGECNV